ncbi:glycosyltransferase family 2 protein [Microbacterium aurum]
MTLVMTLLVRDEADIIVPMLEYHLSAGVDRLIITDNGSVDGTREILARYAADDRVVVEDDPVQDKNQSAKVTRMARRAATEFHADWVLNADADEFFVPIDRSLTLHELFARLSPAIVSATFPVVDMTGAPAVSGTGLERLVFRDERPESTLYERSGLRAHSTHDVLHIGSAEVIVAQGNHYVSLASAGEIPSELGLESLHYPWRSFAQFQSKVVNAGAAYESNPDINPSPRHHGMRDYRLLRAGLLEDAYVYRHPLPSDMPSSDLPEDAWVPHRLAALLESGTAVCADLLADALASSGLAYTPARIDEAHRLMPKVLVLDEYRTVEATAARHSQLRAAELEQVLESSREELAGCRQELAASRHETAHLRAEIDRIRGGRAYRVASTIARAGRSVSAPLRGRQHRPDNP